MNLIDKKMCIVNKCLQLIFMINFLSNTYVCWSHWRQLEYLNCYCLQWRLLTLLFGLSNEHFTTAVFQLSFPCCLFISIFVIPLIHCCCRLSEFPDDVNPVTKEKGGPRGPEPTRYGDWERKGRCVDFWYITLEVTLVNGCFCRKSTDVTSFFFFFKL